MSEGQPEFMLIARTVQSRREADPSRARGSEQTQEVPGNEISTHQEDVAATILTISEQLEGLFARTVTNRHASSDDYRFNQAIDNLKRARYWIMELEKRGLKWT